MTVRNEYERQYARNAVAEVGIANIGAGNEVYIDVPQGALVLAVGFLTDTAFNGTTNTATMTDGTTSFVTAQDVKTTGAETSAGAPKYYPSGGRITVSMAQTGAATAGRGFPFVTYIVLNSVHEIYEG